MFTNLNEWVKNLYHADEYDDLQDEIAVSVGILLFDIIVADNKITTEEVNKLSSLFSKKFGITLNSTEHLIKHIPLLTGDIHEHATIIKNHLNKNGISHNSIMEILNKMIIVDGIDDREYERFDIIKGILESS